MHGSGRKGLEPHRVKEIFLASPAQPNTWVDISATLEVKFTSLFKHESQFEGNHQRIIDLLQDWGADTGQAVGLACAESFKRLILVRDEEA